VDQHTVSVVTDEAVGVDLDLTLFQQQLQFQVGEETMSIRPQSDISTNSLSSNSTTIKIAETASHGNSTWMRENWNCFC